jgi:NADP-dependent 3-hydroxy acid dehydrogenase YdfG
MPGRRQAAAPRSILITGASSGIGAALARAYAGPGVVLALAGRAADRLGAVAAACRTAGAEVRAARLEVTDQTAMAGWVRAVDQAAPLDLVIANAGISGGARGGSGTDEQARAIFAVNLGGTLNTIEPALPLMLARRRGQLGLMSSLAGFRGMPSAPAYCASKAAVRSYGEGLRGRLLDRGIAVSVICPGFVRTPLTARNPFPMPFLMEAERAAAIIKAGLARRRARIAFPRRLYLAVRLLDALPLALTDRWLRRVPGKE